jgi:hypothetical protein
MELLYSLMDLFGKFVKTLGTVLFVTIPAIIAVYVAIKQYYLSKHQIKVELYEKRYKIYLQTKELVWNINSDVTQNDFLFQDFKPVLNEAKFLFGNELVAYLNELIETGKNYRDHTKKMIKELDQIDTEKNKPFIPIDDNFRHYFNNAHYEGGIETKFAPYLNLSDFEKSFI